MEATTVVTELRRRHEQSQQPSSRALVVTIDALNETIDAKKMPRQLSSYAGACFSALENIESGDDASTAAAICTLLAAVLPHLPKTFIAMKFTTISPIVVKTISLLREAGETSGLKWAAQVLAHVLAAPDMEGTWAGAKAPFLLLVRMCMDTQPKIRKVSQQGLADVLALYTGGFRSSASQEIEQVAIAVLTAPKLAAKTAASATKAQREAAEEAIIKAVQESLHFMAALKIVLPILAASTCLRVTDLLLDIFSLSQPLLTMNGLECLIQAVRGFSKQSLDPAKIQQLLTATFKATQPQLEMAKDDTVHLSLIRFFEDTVRLLYEQKPGACQTMLPEVISWVAPMLAADKEAVRFAASGSIASMFQCCVTQAMVTSCAASQSDETGKANALMRCMASLTALLNAGYQDAWTHVLRTFGDIFPVIGAQGASLVQPVLQLLCNMVRYAQPVPRLLLRFDMRQSTLWAACRGAEDGAQYASAAHSAVGACITHIGPAALLEVAPLNVQDLAQCNTWVLPLLRKYTRCTTLALWGSYILPRARVVGHVAIKTRSAGKSEDHLKLTALELQMWNTLESFCRWAVDMPESLEEFGETLGAAFHNRSDLETPICNALKRLCVDTCTALRHFEDSDGAGYGLEGQLGSKHTDTASSVAVPQFTSDDSVPGHMTAQQAAANRDALRGIAHKWMTELLNRFTQLPSDGRAVVSDTIPCLAAVAGEELTVPFYKEALSKVIAALQCLQGGEVATAVIADPHAEVCCFLEVAMLLAPGVSDSGMLPLFRAAHLCLSLKESAAQKRAYKALAYLFQRRPAFLESHKEAAIQSLMETAVVDAACKRYRLKCILPVVLLLSRPEDVSTPLATATQHPEQAAKLIAELVLCIKEVNVKTRNEAYSMLLATARALHEALPPDRNQAAAGMHRSLQNGGLQKIFACTLAGLAAGAPRMVSASLMAIACLFFEFAGDLEPAVVDILPSVCVLLQSKAREIIKAVLGFLRVAAVKLPPDALQPHLGTIVKGLLLWAEDSKNKFKVKVRRLLERLCKKCSYEAVAAVWPESDQKLLTAIRKGFARQARDRGGGSEAGSRVGGSQWGHTRIFSDDEHEAVEEDGDARSRAGQSRRSSVGGGSTRKSRQGGASLVVRANGRRVLEDGEDGDNPVDLLDPSTSRALLTSQGKRRQVQEGDDGEDLPLEQNALGKYVFREGAGDGKPHKRSRQQDIDSDDDSDLGDLKNIGGLSVALKRTRGANSLKGAEKYAHSHASGATWKSQASKDSRARQHSGAKFKAQKAGGDSQGGSKVEPYAYWRFDKQLLNHRQGKKRAGQSGLGRMVKSDAPARGRKAKKN